MEACSSCYLTGPSLPRLACFRTGCQGHQRCQVLRVATKDHWNTCNEQRDTRRFRASTALFGKTSPRRNHLPHSDFQPASAKDGHQGPTRSSYGNSDPLFSETVAVPSLQSQRDCALARNMFQRSFFPPTVPPLPLPLLHHPPTINRIPLNTVDTYHSPSRSCLHHD